MRGLLIFFACLIFAVFIETNDNKHFCFLVILFGLFAVATGGFSRNKE